MKQLFEFGKFGLMVTLGICTLTGCGVSTASKPTVTESKSAEATRGTSIGQIAPDFELEKTDGSKVAFKDLAGNPAVLVFWTAWCPVCKEEVPKIKKLNDEFQAKGVKVIAVNIGESDARISEGIKDFGINYTVAKDKDTNVSKSYKVVGTPTIIFLDKKGAVQYFGNELPKDYAGKLNSILGS